MNSNVLLDDIYVSRKPFYKKPLFFICLGVSIAIIIIIVVIVASSGSSSSSNGERKNESNPKEDEPLPIDPSKPEEEIVPIEPINVKNGFASRYWDCCKPSCSWTANAGSGNEAKSCDVSMNKISDLNSKSICEGGPATTCLDQIPQIFNDTLAYAFAAVPGGTSLCGHCFLLTFTGEGKYESKKNHKMIAGKKLIVIASNIGSDVVNNQFDLMIPGGGVGYYNGCSSILGTNLGKQYGGLLSDCEDEVGWSMSDDEIYTKRKECLVKKCNTIFSGKELAKQGCLFLANWMEAAGNPLHTYYEVTCPSGLKTKYG